MTLSAIDVGEGAPVVLLHGQPGRREDWTAVVRQLQDHMRVVVPDRPGYGETGGHAEGFASNASAVIDLLDRLDIESAVIAGHSWATGIALAAAVQSPGRVSALVLAAPVSPALPPGPVDRALAHPVIGPPVTRAGFWFAGLGLSLPPLRRLAHSAAPGLEPELVAVTALEWRAAGVWKSFYAEQRALVRELPTLTPHLPTIEIPVTIAFGTQDHISPPAHARQLGDLLPNAELIPVEQAGHMLPQQRPELIAELIAGAAPVAS